MLNIFNNDIIKTQLQSDYYSVQSSDKFALFYNSGKQITDFKYDYIFNFFNNIAEVKLNGKWGFINENGEEICEIKYYATTSFSFGKFAFINYDHKWGIIYKNGYEIVPCVYDNIENLMQFEYINDLILIYERNLKLNFI
jgi:hypothetical protein